VEIRSKPGATSTRTRVRKLVTQGFLALSFPLFRPFKVCTFSRGAPVEYEPPLRGDVAQLGEHLLCTQEVTGSSPVISTRTLSTE
jgi:hypothetical protein